MTRAIILAAALLFPSIALVSPTSISHAAPVKGGKVVVAYGNEPLTLDFHAASTSGEYTVMANLGDSLVRIEDGKVMPALATSWKIETPTTIVFRLRKGVRFHDGTPFNAEAVKWNLARLLDDNRKFRSPRADTLGMIDPAKTEVLDESTVRVHTKKPFGPLLTHIAHSVGHMVSPKAAGNTDWRQYARSPVGTGPFRFKEWVAGDHLTLVANPEYWDGRPYLDELEFRFVPEDATRALMVQAGQAHFANYLSPPQAQDLKNNPNVALRLHPIYYTLFLEMHVQKKPFDNVLVRQAVNHAIDKRAIVERVLLGVGRPIAAPVPDTVFGYHPGLKGYEYNLDKAQRLLAEAGYPKGFETELYHPVGIYLGDKQIAEAVQGQLRAAGINVHLVTYDWATVLSRIRAGAAPMWLLGWSNLTGDADYAMFFKFHSMNIGPPGNYSRFKNSRVDELLTKARETYDPAARLKAYQEAQEIVLREAPQVPLVNSVIPSVSSTKLHDVDVQPSDRVLFHKAWIDK